MNTQRGSLVLSILGSALMLGATIYLVSVGLGKVGTATTGADGTMVVVTHRTASILDDSVTVAMLWIVFVLVVAAVGTLSIRYGGIIGAGSVAVVAGLLALVGVLSHLGIYLVPGMACFGGAALLSLVDPLSHDRRREPPRQGFEL